MGSRSERRAGPKTGRGQTGPRVSSRRFSCLTARRRVDESLTSTDRLPATRLLFNAQNGVFGSFSHPKLNYRLSRNFDLLLGFRIDADARFPLLFYQLAEARQHKFAFFFDGFVCKATEAIEEKRGCSFIGLSRRGECVL